MIYIAEVYINKSYDVLHSWQDNVAMTDALYPPSDDLHDDLGLRHDIEAMPDSLYPPRDDWKDDLG